MSRRDSIRDDKPKWEAVVCPAPVFASAQEAQAMHNAVQDNPRQEGEQLSDWMERLLREAGASTSPPVPSGPGAERLPYAREPGEDA